MQNIPKVELHCHLEGIIDPQVLAELEGQGKILPRLQFFLTFNIQFQQG